MYIYILPCIQVEQCFHDCRQVNFTFGSVDNSKRDKCIFKIKRETIFELACSRKQQVCTFSFLAFIFQICVHITSKCQTNQHKCFMK